jgi:SAM-dependent methyltransferase
MAHEFDRDYWERHWREGGTGSMGGNPPNPYLARETEGLTPGTALDAGCGAGAEAIWLATHGWQVTAVDISSEALSRAVERATPSASKNLRWVEADLSTWTPDERFDLVTTHYAHPAMPQLEFYDRVAGWVAPGGTLLIVGHGQGHGQGHGHGHGHEHGPPAEASVTAAAIKARLDETVWEIVTAEEEHRTITGHGGAEASLDDVVVRAVRHPAM